MKIDIKMPRDIPFESLAIGDLLCYCGDIYIKTDLVKYEDCGELYNSVLIRDGSLEYFENGQFVNKVDGELNVKFCLE